MKKYNGKRKFIEDEKKEILALITYAKQIRQSLLPIEKNTDKTLKRLQK